MESATSLQAGSRLRPPPAGRPALRGAPRKDVVVRQPTDIH
jgi:hypothetical protein